MKKTVLILLLSLSALFAHECDYSLQLTLDTNKGLLRGTARISTDHDSVMLLDTAANITSIANARLVVRQNRPHLLKGGKDEPIELTFLYGLPEGRDVVLLDGWYPAIDLMCRYRTRIEAPGLKAVTEATRTEKGGDGTLYIFDRPLDALHLVASDRYETATMRTDAGVELTTYLYPEDAPLSKRYLERSADYFKRYKKMFGFLPYRTFSVVETPFPAGYSMPTFTLIGKQIIDKPFVLDTSLGHEIVHQWFGNYVYAPYRGNWVEGLTTFYSDYLYAKEAHEGSRYRKELLIKYDSYVTGSNEIALIEFTSKTKESKNAVGYGKATFFFSMLEKRIGEKAFRKGIDLLLKRYPYKEASYKDLRQIFEEASGSDLLEFFKTWVYRKGAFDFSITDIGLGFVDDRYELTFDIHSNKMLSRLPIKVCSETECLWETIDLGKKHQKLELDIEPKTIVVDENYEIFRRLQPQEVPPVISRILDGDVTVIVDRKDRKRFSKMMNVFKNVVWADEVKFDTLKKRDILVLGERNRFLKQVAIPFTMEGDTKIELFKNPFNRSRVIAVFESRKLSRTFFYRLRHLGKYSTVVIRGGKIVKSVTKPSQKGARFNVRSGSYALKPTLDPLASIFPDLTGRKVVFIGEQHTDFSNHLNQLKIIKAMVEAGNRVAIGMEMFQQPYQKYLDDYIAGKISEKEMLKKTEYFKRWKYNYHLYRPIILYARKMKLPIVALNIEKEITKKVVREGIDALSKRERAKVPDSIDFANSEYKEELRRIFSSHQSHTFKDFDEFFYAQLLWDETMAKNVVRFLDRHPGYTMAVLAGNGHVMFGYGIPDRVKRRGITDYRIVVNSMKPKPGIADYLLYPEPIETAKEKKIGVYLEGDDDLKVVKLVKDSPAQKAGIKKGDRIVAIDGERVTTIPDLKLALFFTGKEAKVTLLRDGKEMDLSVEF
ncbi:ChaN family lipoprotein [Hydrogenimonas sp.]